MRTSALPDATARRSTTRFAALRERDAGYEAYLIVQIAALTARTSRDR